MRKLIFSIIMTFLCHGTTYAEDSNSSLGSIEKKQDLDKTITLAESLYESFGKNSENVEIDCQKAFGEPKFCKCLKSKLPVILNFTNYIQIVTSSKVDLDYDNLDKERKKVIDVAREARDKCVQKS